MGNHKKVMCNICYRDMRIDILKRHMKQHSKKNESVPATNILVTNNIYNNPPSVSTSDPTKKSNEKTRSIKWNSKIEFFMIIKNINGNLT